MSFCIQCWLVSFFFAFCSWWVLGGVGKHFGPTLYQWTCAYALCKGQAFQCYMLSVNQTWNSSKTFHEQEFWGGILPQKQRMFGPSKRMKKRVIFGQYMDQCTILGSIYNLWINPMSDMRKVKKLPRAAFWVENFPQKCVIYDCFQFMTKGHI